MPAPVAEPFSTRGKIGSGFPLCTTSVDVSDYFLTNPMTFAQISSLYWNVYSASGTASLFRAAGEDPELDPEIDIEVTTVGDDAEDLILEEPKDRVCSGVSSLLYEAFPPSNYYAVTLEIRSTWGVFKMYDGPVTEEANFIGYGIQEGSFLALAGAYEDGGNGRVGVSRFLVSACKYDPDPAEPYEFDSEESLWFQQYSILATNYVSASETTVSGYPFVALNWDDPVATFGFTVVTEITDLEFYTYP